MSDKNINSKIKPIKSTINICKNKKINQKDKNKINNLSKNNIFSKNEKSSFKTIDKKKSEKNNEDDFLNNNILFSDRSKNSTSSNFYPKSTRHTEDTSLRNTKKSFYTINNNDNISNSTTYEIYKANLESLKEKKIYLEKVRYMQNHLNLLKSKEQELHRKVELKKEKEKNLNKKKKEKENIKRSLLSAEIDRRSALEEKKKATMMQKLKTNLGLKMSQDRKINEKIYNYKQAINNKKKTEEKRIENYNKQEKFCHMKIEKLKNEREKNREKNLRKKKDKIMKLNNSYIISYKNNLNETKRLKDELLKLELMEEKHLENLKNTQNYLKITNDNEENTFINNHRKINSLIENGFQDNDKRKTLSVKRRYKSKNINNDNAKKDKTSSLPKI